MKRWRKIRERLSIQGGMFRRRWYLALASGLLMVGISAAVLSNTVVYYARVDVLFLIPGETLQGNQLLGDPGRALYLAAVVEKRFNESDGGSTPQTTVAPLYGTGIRSGHWVHIPNSGGQWESSFNRPQITVEVVAATPDEVLIELDRYSTQVMDLAAAAQEGMGILPGSKITTDLWPPVSEVSEIGGRPSRVKIGMFALSLIVIGTTVSIGDRLGNRRSNPGDGDTGPDGSPPDNDTPLAGGAIKFPDSEHADSEGEGSDDIDRQTTPSELVTTAAGPGGEQSAVASDTQSHYDSS